MINWTDLLDTEPDVDADLFTVIDGGDLNVAVVEALGQGSTLASDGDDAVFNREFD